jgi:hypothetical protein
MASVFLSFISARYSGEAAFLPDLFLQAEVDPPGVPDNLADILRPGFEDLVKHLPKALSDLMRNPVDDPFSLPDVFGQVGIPEDAELVGNARLLHLEDEHELADAEVSPQKKPEDTKTGGVGQGFERLDGVSHLNYYMNIYSYINRK